MVIAGCCFQQNTAQATDSTWIVNVTAVDTRYSSIPSSYNTTVLFPSSFNISVGNALPANLVCQPPLASDNDTSAIFCQSTNSESFVVGFVLTSGSNSTTAPAVKSLDIDSSLCSNLTKCNSETALSAGDVRIGSQVYPKWAVALTSVVVAAILLCIGIIIIKICVSRQRRAARLELRTEYSDISRRPTDTSNLSHNEKHLADQPTYNQPELGNDIIRYRNESSKEAYQQLPDIDVPTKNGNLPPSSSFQRLALGSKTLLTSLPSLPSLPKLPSFSTMPLFLSNSSSSQDSSLEEEPFRPKADSSMLLDSISESSASSSIKNNNTVRSRAAVEAHKVIRRASRKSKTRSTIFTEEHINKIFQLDDGAKHKSMNELYPQYGDIRNKSTTTLCSGINSSTPSSVRVKHRELTVLEGMQAALIERSMSASNVIDQSDDNDSNTEENMPRVASDHEDVRPKTRNRSSSLTQGMSKTYGDFDHIKAKSFEDFHYKSLEFRGRQRRSMCSSDAKRRSQSATPSASSTIRPRSFLLPRSIYDEDSSSDDNSDTITRAKFQRRYRSLSRAESQKSYSTRRKSRPTSCMSNTSDVDTIRKHLRDSWKAELSESQSQDSLTVDADLPPAIPRVQRRPPLPEGFMRRRSDRFSRPESIVEPIPEPAPPNDLTSQDSLDTLSSFVPEQGYTSEDTESITYSNVVSLAILHTDTISSGLSVLSNIKGKHETESSIGGVHETNSESNRSVHSAQSFSDLAVGDPRPSAQSFY
ncbi:hypothetical protein NQZ79_g4115 [Umbelopsis isabellina]|nr:hypothetical protein NQZ79_g4115 [Umbelopsis isabellina]